jgi:hypothetical protein
MAATEKTRRIYLEEDGTSLSDGDTVVYHSFRGKVLAVIEQVRTDDSLDLKYRDIKPGEDIRKGSTRTQSTFAVPRGEGPGTWNPE